MNTAAHDAVNIPKGPSTGPKTEAGKQKSSRNAIRTGLYAARDFMREGEEEEYAQSLIRLMDELTPEGTLEETFATEIMGATWRLRRCRCRRGLRYGRRPRLRPHDGCAHGKAAEIGRPRPTAVPPDPPPLHRRTGKTPEGKVSVRAKPGQVPACSRTGTRVHRRPRRFRRPHGPRRQTTGSKVSRIRPEFVCNPAPTPPAADGSFCKTHVGQVSDLPSSTPTRRTTQNSSPKRPLPLRFRSEIQALLRPARSKCLRRIRSEARLGSIAALQRSARLKTRLPEAVFAGRNLIALHN